MNTTKLIESAIELLAIELLENQGYEYLYGPDIAPDGKTPLRANFGDVILVDKLNRNSAVVT